MILISALLLSLTGPTGSSSADSLAAAAQCLAPLPAAASLQPWVRSELSEQRDTLIKRIADSRHAPTDTELAAAYGSLGQLYHSHLIFEPADACYRAALALSPNDHRAHYLLGYLQQQRGRVDAAAASYQRALQLAPDMAPAALRLALIRFEQQRDDEAQQLLTTWQQQPRYRAWVLYQLGQQALATEHYQQAIDWLQQALATSPDADRIHYPLAMAWRGLGDRRQARQQLQLAGEQAPALPDPLIDALEQLKTHQHPHYANAIAAIKRHDYPTAISEFEASLANAPNNLKARTSLARALFLNGDDSAAGEQLRSIVNSPGQQPPALALFMLAVWHQHHGRHQQAEALYRQTLNIDPEHGGAHYYLANQLLQRGDYQAAIKHYRITVQLVPGNRSARLRELIARHHAGAAETETLSQLERLHHDQADDPATSYYLARLLSLAKDPALRDPQRADRLAHSLNAEYPGPNQTELLALTSAALGHYQQAQQWLQASIDAAREHAPQLLPALLALQHRYRQKLPPTEAAFPLPIELPPLNAALIFQEYPSSSPY